MLRRVLHRVLVLLMPICFNILNFLLAGNLPPLGGTSVIVEEQERFLLVKGSGGKMSFPGGFMRWREHPAQTARRECREETGLNVEALEVIGTYPRVSTSPWQVSTINIVFAGKLAPGGKLRGSIEGQPLWVTEAEMHRAMRVGSAKMLEDYYAYRKRADAH